MRFALAFVLASLAAVPASAQQRMADVITSSGEVRLCTQHESHHAFHGVNPVRRSTEAKSMARSATFEVTYVGFSAQAQAAFQAAVDIWATHISSPIPIRVEARFESLGANVLGSASAGRIHAFNSGAGIVPLTWYGSPLADALAGRDLCGPGTSCAGAPDIIARFSSTRSDWYFGTDGNPPTGRYDFTSVVLHELGHGLGFFGSVNRDDGVERTNPRNVAECTGTAGDICHSFLGFTTQGYPTIFDRFVEDVGGTAMLNTSAYPNPSSPGGALNSLIQGQNLFWDSPTVLTVNQNQRAELFAPSPFDPGSSFSHWDENRFPAGSENALMTPQIGTREAYGDPGPATCALFQDIGWTLGEGCTRLVVNDEPTPEPVALTLDLAGPNPFRASTAVRVRLGEPQAVRATLLDALGREVGRLYDGPATGTLTLPIAGDLAPGPYTVHVVTEAGRATASVVRVR